MGLFGKASATQVFGNSKYFQPGRYLVQLQKVKCIDGNKGVSFIVEALIKGADSDHPAAPRVGEIAAHVWGLGDSKVRKEMGMANWWAFAMAALGIEDKDQASDEEWEEASEQIIDKGSLEGQLMRVDVFTKKTKADTDFTVHKWLREANPEDLAEFGLSAAE